ncbi:MAG: hypothetical protein WAJ85_01390 [Candidatus Baltobacteraceae bacterium]|jgi:hypothetical protein
MTVLDQAKQTVRAKVEREAAYVWGVLGAIFGSVATAGAMAALHLTK